MSDEEPKRSYYERNREKVRAKNRAYYLANREKLRQQGAEWFAANREKQNAKRLQWHVDHKEYANAKAKEYADAHRQEIRAWQKADRQANPEKHRLRDKERWNGERQEKGNQVRKVRFQKARLDTPWAWLLMGAKRRAAKSGIPFTIDADWAKARWTGKCEVTGLEFRLGLRERGPKFWSPSLDQIEPKKGYTPGNSRFVLWAINSFKHDASDADMFLVAQAFIRNYTAKSNT